MALRIGVLVTLAWLAINVLAVVYPRSVWMEVMFAAWLLLMSTIAVLAAQRSTAAVFYRVVACVTFITFVGTQFEPYSWSPHAHLRSTFISFSDLSNLGPGAERSYAIINNRFYFLACCNTSFLIGSGLGWLAMLLERRRHSLSGVNLSQTDQAR